MYQDFFSTPFTNVPRFPLNTLNKCTKIPSQRPLQMYQDSLSTPFTNVPRFNKFLSLVIELSPAQVLKVQINKGNNSFRWIMVHMQYTSSQCPLRLYWVSFNFLLSFWSYALYKYGWTDRSMDRWPDYYICISSENKDTSTLALDIYFYICFMFFFAESMFSKCIFYRYNI